MFKQYKFRKHVEALDAVQYTGDNAAEIVAAIPRARLIEGELWLRYDDGFMEVVNVDDYITRYSFEPDEVGVATKHYFERNWA